MANDGVAGSGCWTLFLPSWSSRYTCTGHLFVFCLGMRVGHQLQTDPTNLSEITKQLHKENKTCWYGSHLQMRIIHINLRQVITKKKLCGPCNWGCLVIDFCFCHLICCWHQLKAPAAFLMVVQTTCITVSAPVPYFQEEVCTVVLCQTLLNM